MSRSQAKSLQLQLASKTPSLDLSQLLLPPPSTGIISSCSLRLSIRMYTHTHIHVCIYISFPEDRTKACFTGRTILGRSVISRNGSSGENNRSKLARHFVSRLNTIYVETAIGVSGSWIARQRGRSWATLCREGI